ncbi:MAG: sigma-70 family RNA polymerase sigma factor [Chthoniobacterales bacterium]
MPAETTNPSRAANFHATRWTLILTASQGDASASATIALEELCRIYWYPLYAYVRRRGHSPHDAQDLAQEFFARLFEKNKLAGITREGGKFRSFLLTAMNHFLTDEWKRASTQKRGGTQVLSLDGISAETRYAQEPHEESTPEKMYELNWALTLLETVFQKLQAEYTEAGKEKLFADLKFCLTGERNALPYSELAAQLNMSEGSVKVAVHRMRQRYRELLREEVADTVMGADEVEGELRYLFQVLAR